MRILFAVGVAAATCQPPQAPSTPSSPSAPRLTLCADAPDPGTARVESLSVRGDDLSLMISFWGCASDTLTVCWRGEVEEDGYGPFAEVFVGHTSAWCDQDLARGFSVNAFDIRLAAFHQDLDAIEIRADGQYAEMSW